MPTPPTASQPKPKHRLLIQSRQWHKWGGLIAALFLLVLASSGIVLNYKQPIFSALGLEGKARKPEPAGNAKAPAPALSTSRGLVGLPVNLERALEIARAEWGDVPLERLELKTERGETLFKLKRKGGGEIWINATTGAHFLKAEYEKVSQAATGEVVSRRTDWGKILLDLHTGKIGGAVGQAIMTAAAGLLLLLTLSGVYLWLKPGLIRRHNIRATAVSTLSEPVLPPLPTRANRRQSFASRR